MEVLYGLLLVERAGPAVQEIVGGKAVAMLLHQDSNLGVNCVKIRQNDLGQGGVVAQEGIQVGAVNKQILSCPVVLQNLLFKAFQIDLKPNYIRDWGLQEVEIFVGQFVNQGELPGEGGQEHL